MFDETLTLWHRYGRIARFIMAGGTGAAVNLAALYTIVQLTGMYPVYASIGSFICAFFVSFTLQKYWTYKNRDERAGSQMTIYFVIQLINLAINAALMYLLVEYTPLHYLVAQVLTSSVVAIESFFLYKHVVFIEQVNKTS